jgi:hypothetical protein
MDMQKQANFLQLFVANMPNADKRRVISLTSSSDRTEIYYSIWYERGACKGHVPKFLMSYTP